MRPLIAALAWVAFVVTATAANLSLWVATVVMDRAAFVEVTTAAVAREDVRTELAAEAIDVALARAGLSDPVRAPWLEALGLRSPAPLEDVSAALRDRVTLAVADPAVVEVLRVVVGDLHGVVTGQGADGGTVRADGPAVSVDLVPVFGSLRAALPPDLRALVRGVQAQDLRFSLGTVEALPRLRGALGTLDRVAVLLPVLAVLLAALVIVVARDRAVAVAGIGAGASIAGGVGLVAAPLLSGLVGGADDGLVRLVVGATIRSLTRPLADASLVLLAAGFVVIVIGVALRALLPRPERVREPDRVAPHPYARYDPYQATGPYDEPRSPRDR